MFATTRFPGALTYVQAAAYLSIAPGTLRNLVSEERGPISVKIGRSRRFRPADLEAFLASKVVGLPAPALKQTRPGRPTKAEQVARRQFAASGS